MKICKYCGKEIEKENVYCNSECQEKAKKFSAFRKKYMPIMVTLILLCLAIEIIGFIVARKFSILSKLGLFGVGFLLLVFPFGNAEEMMGIRKSKMMVRMLGIIVMVVTVILCFFV